MKLKNKVALVTGASRGIGAEIARQMATEGASVFLAAADPLAEIETVAEACRKINPAATFVCGEFDFSRAGDGERMVEAASSAFGRVDILVNNAAVRTRKAFGDFTSEDFDRDVAINLKAPFMISQEVGKIMLAQKSGRIIHIASQMGSIAEQNLALYGLTKAALIHLTMSMAFELAPHGISVNAVSPGPTMTEYNVARTTANPDYFKHKMSMVRSGRYSDPAEIAEAVLFLATTRATNIQGHNLIVDGGYVIH